LSNPRIPLLTDIVADPQDENPEYVRTQLMLPRPATPADPARGPNEFEYFAIFEPDLRRAGDADAAPTGHEEHHHELSHQHDDATIEPSDNYDDAALEPSDNHDDTTIEATKSPGEYRAETLEIDDIETVIAELQTRLASSTFELIDQHMRTAFSDMEARIFREISTNLREQLPELIDSVVRDHLQERSSQTDEGD